MKLKEYFRYTWGFMVGYPVGLIVSIPYLNIYHYIGHAAVFIALNLSIYLFLNRIIKH